MHEFQEFGEFPFRGLPDELRFSDSNSSPSQPNAAIPEIVRRINDPRKGA